MTNIIKAEFLKQKRTMSSKLIFVFPIITLVMAFVLTTGMTNAYAESVWNWWYVLLLPGMIAIVSYLSIMREKKNGYYNIKTLPIEKRNLMLGKIAYLGILVLVSNVVLFAGATMGGAFLTTSVPVVGAAITVLVLSIVHLWQIPLFLFLSEKFGMVVELIACLFITVLGTIVAPSGKWFLFLSAVPMRIVTPLLHVLPNGLRAQAGDPLLNASVIFPGILIALVWFVVLTYLYLNWFEKREVK
ncbi:ABC-2 type transport system permease protein [Butyrivibrio fibrisolvens]|uniref:ABC-2 type transport system permease protein n=1 Tax=Butyrivibrio fibrisolvens TaxID=831 RepID=A0A1H9MUI2_BUTFI|nr:lantibiotic immunity ABC transporter MutE/EpiE family permease subunit [Butyrivibrio fibrisolvens]SER26773.1 ABC-2 type transport system permease protein [Butyrivibrio fibrisolvens]